MDEEREIAKSEGQDAELLQGARHTIDLYRALGERPVWSVASRPDRVELPLRPVPAGGGLAAGYVVEARVKDGKRLKLLLDTGASGLFAVERVIAKGGFAPLSADTVLTAAAEAGAPRRSGAFSPRSPSEGSSSGTRSSAPRPRRSTRRGLTTAWSGSRSSRATGSRST